MTAVSQDPQRLELVKLGDGPIAFPLYGDNVKDSTADILSHDRVVYQAQEPSEVTQVQPAALPQGIAGEQAAYGARDSYIKQQLEANSGFSNVPLNGAELEELTTLAPGHSSLPILDPKSFPNMSLVDMGLPQFGIPNITVPNVDVPEISLPVLNTTINLPLLSVPNVSLHDVHLSLPNIPPLPQLNFPNVNLSSLQLPNPPPLPPVPKLHMENITLPFPPLESLDPARILKDYPFNLPKVEIPNAMEGAKTATENVMTTLALLPLFLLGGTSAMAQTAAQIGRQAMVTGNHLLLTQILGVQPTNNNGQGEYRRITQVPDVRYQLTKESPLSLSSEQISLPQWASKNYQQRLLRDAQQNVEDLINQENDLQNKVEILKKKNGYLLETFHKDTAKGDLGGENTSKQLLASTAEKTATKVHPLISQQYYTPINDRMENRILLKEGAWLPRVGRTYKSTESLLPKDAIKTKRVIRKHSPLESLEEAELLGPLKAGWTAQMAPRRAERLD